ncbi:MAG: N-acetyl-gamma-glutamyl-phosphate reductase [Coriobacteriia bacterium]|jgi:N-acetyl-gamma-glutamyl-phosphate reductase (EC 1.2.1.38)
MKAAILGAAGYAGVELTRLLLGHPCFELVTVTSDRDAGKRVADVYPALATCDLVYQSHDAPSLGPEVEVVFLAVPHTAAMAVAPGLLAEGRTVIDASADFRLRDAGLYAAWYGTPHAAPALLDEAVYGLPELWRDSLPGARLVACPGCYPTASLLAVAPAIEAGVTVSDRVVIDAKSGVSGAGRSPSAAAHFCAANEAVAAYKAGAHRHTPEIAQGLADLGMAHPRLTFVPHLVPMTRGLLATAYLEVEPGFAVDEAHELYAARFAAEPFVTVHSPSRMPSTGEVSGTNRAHIGVAVDELSATLIVSVAIDNLVKGTSGQAVQCANLALGLTETAGLDLPCPVV